MELSFEWLLHCHNFLSRAGFLYYEPNPPTFSGGGLDVSLGTGIPSSSISPRYSPNPVQICRSPSNVYKLLQSSLAQLARNSIIQTLKWKLNATGLAKSGTFLKSAGNDSRKV
ncbi:hypothetical protein EDC04DRAFT_2639466 [Pisolithus marmoratus]|nr:hypothetical protein EDC04DRAFT_2639466 [Pisolithus marmoratus]